MKIITLGATLALSVLSWSAVAVQAVTDHAKQSVEEQCQAMGKQHGMKDDKMEAWMKKCMEISQHMKDDMESNGASEADDTEDPRDGDQDMNHDMGHN